MTNIIIFQFSYHAFIAAATASQSNPGVGSEATLARFNDQMDGMGMASLEGFIGLVRLNLLMCEERD